MTLTGSQSFQPPETAPAASRLSARDRASRRPAQASPPKAGCRQRPDLALTAFTTGPSEMRRAADGVPDGHHDNHLWTGGLRRRHGDRGNDNGPGRLGLHVRQRRTCARGRERRCRERRRQRSRSNHAQHHGERRLRRGRDVRRLRDTDRFSTFNLRRRLRRPRGYRRGIEHRGDRRKHRHPRRPVADDRTWRLRPLQWALRRRAERRDGVPDEHHDHHLRRRSERHRRAERNNIGQRRLNRDQRSERIRRLQWRRIPERAPAEACLSPT